MKDDMATKVNMDRHIREGWTVGAFIRELAPQVEMIMSGQSWREPFRNKQELADWCRDNQPYYKYQAENAVSSFFYYMWNAWSEEECRTVFKEMYPHFWEKWSLMTDKGVFGASERFYAELTDHYREKLVERAVSLYDGKARRKLPDDSRIRVCSDCGSAEIEIQAWVDVNTNEYHSDVDDDIWCSRCADNVETCSRQSFLEKMQEWWKSNNTEALEYLTGLKASDFPSDDSGQTFAEAADEWWNGKSYDGKRDIYLANN